MTSTLLINNFGTLGASKSHSMMTKQQFRKTKKSILLKTKTFLSLITN